MKENIAMVWKTYHVVVIGVDRLQERNSTPATSQNNDSALCGVKRLLLDRVAPGINVYQDQRERGGERRI